MKRRIFVAFRLPEEIKGRIAYTLNHLQKDIPSGTRFVGEENWHATLSFLGDQDEASIGIVLEVLKKFSEDTIPPTLEFEKIIFGPVNRGEVRAKTPRMIWFLGNTATSEVLGKLQRDLEDRLLEAGLRFLPERRAFQLHVTLAHLSTPPSSVLEAPLSLELISEGVELMESELLHSGARYTSLSYFLFQN